jgi:ATP-dependent helicase HepA
MEMKPGQRWISNTEAELGLGLVLEVDFNRVTVLYLASGERRVYSKANAPLTRVQFSPGDVIASSEGITLTVDSVEARDGLLHYSGHDEKGNLIELDETELDHHIQFNKPQDRLLIGQFDPPAWFQLRYETWQRQAFCQQSEVKGLQGARAALIPHQIYIAYEAANRVQPRVMLADEVGLGKTIEAGLIMHHRLLNGLSHRILVVVPDALLHQWLVEMLRRFNLRFSLFDEARCQAQTDNPFLTEQLILSGQEFFKRNPERQKQALSAGWDMVVVDEAHHLEWDELQPSDEYLFVEQLGLNTPGLILLTATPEQMGVKSHFARLRLLDPDRFYDFQQFLTEQKHYDSVAQYAQRLLTNEDLTDEELSCIQQIVQQDRVERLLSQLNHPENRRKIRNELIQLLLDQHGTGRILFRNSRQTVKGFPERQCDPYALSAIESSEAEVYQNWLLERLKKLGDDKVLLICQKAETVIALEKWLREKHGVASAIFHEGMSIVERDRAAAYFADSESPAKVLLCSEIGSEGRNFQFVHHLILYDLPDNPDLLQQRIGRLDRIGQKEVIQIHVPYVENTTRQVLFQWYHHGMDAFRHNCAGAALVYEQVRSLLEKALASPDEETTKALIGQTRHSLKHVEEQLKKGRDPLLELNSCRPERAQHLIALLRKRDQEGSLWPYMEQVFDCYGVDSEFHSPDCYILKPGENMRDAYFPLLGKDGVTVTTNRNIALAREDMQFLTDEHPMVVAAMDQILSSETGNAAVSVIQHPALEGGQFLLEILFIIECSAPAVLQISRYLPPTPIRILIDQYQQNRSQEISHQSLIDTGDQFDKQQIAQFLNTQRDVINAMIRLAERDARESMRTMVANSRQMLLQNYQSEINRLERLQQFNPSIKPEEIEQLKELALLSDKNIRQAQLKLDALRFLMAI